MDATLVEVSIRRDRKEYKDAVKAGEIPPSISDFRKSQCGLPEGLGCKINEEARQELFRVQEPRARRCDFQIDPGMGSHARTCA